MSALSLASTASAVALFPRRSTAPSTFANPVAAGADPWVVYHEGWYYWCLSVDMRGVAIYRSPTLTALGGVVSLWHPPAAGPHCAEIWAPELHRLDGRWYVYVAASNGNNATHRMIVLEVEGAHPTGQMEFKAELYTGDDIVGRTHNRWAIDGTVLMHGGRRYFLWSGWADERDEQWLYIAEMLNPWTVSSNRVRLCANDDFVWERIGESPSGRGLNEGPQVLQRHGRVFVVFSASGSWETSYKLGMLELRPGGNPLTARDWIKSPEPVFAATETTWGVGHCSFTQSPDGTEDWIAFHAKVERAHNWKRVIHVQPFSWDATGRPVFGRPQAAGEALASPSTLEAAALEPLQAAVG
jgi:GH43 family beta-xylosidase